MGKLIVSVQMTVDAVMDSQERWFLPEGEHEEQGFDQLRTADALVLGRRTYEGLARIWPRITDTSGFADRMNALPKYVASTTLREPLTWNASLLDGDPAKGVSRLKHEHAGNLVMYGCGGLARHLVGHGLVDEIRCWVHPTVWGGPGTRIFHDGDPVPLRLASTTMFRSGVALLTYHPSPA